MKMFIQLMIYIGLIFHFTLYGQESDEHYIEAQICYAVFSFHDLNQAIDKLNQSDLHLDKIHNSSGFMLNYYKPLNPRWALIIGLGTYQASSDDKLKIRHTSESGDEIGFIDLKHQIRCLDYHIKTGMNYQLLNKPVKTGIIGSITLHVASLSESGTTQSIVIGSLNRKFKYTQTATSWGLGAEFSINPVIPLHEKWFFYIDLGYRIVNITNFNSNWVSDHFTLDFTGVFFRVGLRYLWD